MHFSSGSKVWYQIITIKIFTKLELTGQIQDLVYLFLPVGIPSISTRVTNQIKLKNWLKEICCSPIYCIFPLRNGGMFWFYLLNQSRFLFQDAFPSGIALFHGYVI